MHVSAAVLNTVCMLPRVWPGVWCVVGVVLWLYTVYTPLLSIGIHNYPIYGDWQSNRRHFFYALLGLLLNLRVDSTELQNCS